jgi:hypothetical protein
MVSKTRVRMNSISAAILPISELFKLEDDSTRARLTGFPTKSQLEFLECGQTSCCGHVLCQRAACQTTNRHHTGYVSAFQSADLDLYHGPRLPSL